MDYQVQVMRKTDFFSLLFLGFYCFWTTCDCTAALVAGMDSTELSYGIRSIFCLQFQSIFIINLTI